MSLGTLFIYFYAGVTKVLEEKKVLQKCRERKAASKIDKIISTLFLIVHTICEWLFFYPFHGLTYLRSYHILYLLKFSQFLKCCFFLLFVFSPGAFTTMVFRWFLPIYVSSSASLPLRTGLWKNIVLWNYYTLSDFLSQWYLKKGEMPQVNFNKNSFIFNSCVCFFSWLVIV